jgi:hypothetical protein
MNIIEIKSIGGRVLWSGEAKDTRDAANNPNLAMTAA